MTEMKTWESEPFYFMISIVSENEESVLSLLFWIFFRNIISSYQLHNLICADFQGVQKASNSHFKNKILRYLRSNHIIFFSCLRFFLVVLIYTQGRTDHLPYHFWSQGRVVLKHTALWFNLWQCTQHSISAHQTIFSRQ